MGNVTSPYLQFAATVAVACPLDTTNVHPGIICSNKPTAYRVTAMKE